MPQQTIQLQDGTQLDPKVVKVMKAIRNVESGGKYDAIGDSGTSKGAYQWHGDNWKTAAKTVLGDENAEMTPANQNKVAYHQIKAYKDQGLQPEEIAARWNGAKIDKVTGRFTYVNPEYGTKFRAALGKSGEPQAQPIQEEQKITAPEKKKGGGLIEGAKAVGDFLFPIVGDVYHDIKGDSQKGFLQQGADLGLSALPFIPGLGWGGEAARGVGLAAKLGGSALVKGAGIGAAAGGLQSVAQGGNLGDVAKGAATGAVTGGLLGGAGRLVTKAASTLPQRFVMKYIPKLNEDTAAWTAKTKNLGSPSKMLVESDSNIAKLEPELGAALEDKANSYVQPNGPDILAKIAQKFPDSGLTVEEVAANLQKLAPLKKNLIQKLVTGQDMTLDELHKLNSAIGKATYKTVFDDPMMRAGKEVGNVAYHEIGNIIKSSAPKSGPIFDELSKEYSLNKALQAAVRSGEKHKAFGLPEIMSLIGGFSALGPMGALGAIATQKAVQSPRVGLKTAGLIRGLGSKKSSVLGKQLIPQISRGVTGLVSPASASNTQ